MPRQRLEHSFNNYNYISEFDLETQEFNFEINYPVDKEKPTFLFKYYNFNQNNINAVISNYLFSPHPDQLNDKYDCSSDLIDYSNIRQEIVYQILVIETKKYTEQKFREIWNSDKKWVLIRLVADYERTRLFMKFGIISLSSNENNTLLWSYYAQNSGIAIKLKTDLLPSTFIGPFFINYTTALTKIVHVETNAPLCMHYQTNVKDQKWEHEDEWRYITFKPDGHFHPVFGIADIKSRKFFYRKDAVEEIILGYNFFNIKEISRQEGYDLIALTPPRGRGRNEKKLKRKLLSYIVKSKIPCSQVIRKTQEYALFNMPVTIEQISCNRFKITSNAPAE
jgi:hypothetical protein